MQIGIRPMVWLDRPSERNRRHAPKGVVRTLDRLNHHARNTGWVIALDAGDLEVLHQMFA